jgi:hypothetical protein
MSPPKEFEMSIVRVAAVVAVAALIAVGFAQPVSAGESFATARAKCAKKLRQSCYSQHLWHIRGGRCWVFRGVANGRVGRTYRCPGSPLYVW